VVRSSTQHEHVGATTEVIANHNRCHALTIQHFEVLRHFAVHERLAGVQECLFVPLEMTLFDDAKVLRWYDILHRSCRRRSVEPGFPSIRRLNSPDQIPPDRRFADDPIEEMSGSLSFRVSIARPKDPTAETEAALDQTEWGFLGFMLKVQPETIYEQYRRNSAKRDKIFQDEIAPEAARIFLESLQVVLIDRDGGEHDAGFDVTVASRYQQGGIMEVALDDTGAGPRLTRANIAGVEIRTDYPLPEYSKVLLETARIDYRTERMRHELFGGRPLDDVQVGDSAFLSTGALSWEEERNQLREDRSRRRRLLRHLNDNIEYYHRAIWLGMDSNRRFMLLDGFEAPQFGGALDRQCCREPVARGGRQLPGYAGRAGFPARSGARRGDQAGGQRRAAGNAARKALRGRTLAAAPPQRADARRFRRGHDRDLQELRADRGGSFLAVEGLSAA
jgi:hypothetical protein